MLFKGVSSSMVRGMVKRRGRSSLAGHGRAREPHDPVSAFAAPPHKLSVQLPAGRCVHVPGVWRLHRPWHTRAVHDVVKEAASHAGWPTTARLGHSLSLRGSRLVLLDVGRHVPHSM